MNNLQISQAQKPENMFYRHDRNVGYRRYGEILAIVSYMKGEVTLIREPAASLWEKMASPISLSDAIRYISDKAGFSVSLEQIYGALSLLIQNGTLVSAENRRLLDYEINKISSDKGCNTDELFAKFYSTLNDNIPHLNILKADVETNNACNLRCIHCYISDYIDKHILTLEEINRLLFQLSKIGVLFLGLTGGEIALRKDFLEIVRSARQYNFVITILSNATCLTDHKIEQLAALGPANVFVSLYGVTPETHEFVTKRSGSYASTMDTIHKLRGLGIPVVLRYLLMKHNFQELEALPELADQLDCLYNKNYNLFVTYGDKEKTYQNRISNQDLFLMFSKNIVPPPQRPKCIAGTSKLRISAEGDVYPCELLRLRLGNIRQSSIEEIISSKETKDYLKTIYNAPESCNDCHNFDFCPRCPGLAFHEDGSLTSKSREACRVTELYLLAKEQKTYRDIGDPDGKHHF